MPNDPEWIFIGSAPECQVRVAGSGVAARHARACLDRGRARIEDLGSPAGTALNSPDRRISVSWLEPADLIYVGSYPIPARLVFEALCKPAPDAGSNPTLSRTSQTPVGGPPPPGLLALHVERGVTVIGREPSSANKQTIVLPNPMVSRNHAGLLRTDKDEYYLWDLGSTHGTFLDSQRVGRRRVPVSPNQVIGIAGYRFSIGAQGTLAVAAPKDTGVEIRGDGIATEVGSPWRRFTNLDGVRLYVPARRLVALMGPSGAGKTTLLRVLAGQTPPKSGRVLFNERDLYTHFNEIRSSLGYVPQEDILHPELTVRSALFYSARLRLPVDYSSAEIQRRIDEIMVRLGISNQANVIIGSAEKRGVSGGQRKRVNLAMELLADPSVLLLDEPTSGLSSSDSERVVRTLRELANEGRTVIVTIHQPAVHVFEMFDDLCVIDNHTVRLTPPPAPQPGRLIFLGPVSKAPAYFHSLNGAGSKGMTGADAIFDAIEKNPQKTTGEWEANYQASPLYRTYIYDPLSRPVPAAAPSSKRRNLPSPLHQFQTLFSRLWRIKVSDNWSMIQMLMLQPLIVAIGIVLITGTLETKTQYGPGEYLQEFLRIGKGLFFLTFSAIWFGCNNAAREIVGEIAVYRRERMVGLSLFAYLGSKLAFFAGICGVQCAILVSTVAVACDLKANWAMLWLDCWLAAIAGVAFGLLISSLVSSSERAIQLVPLALLPMIFFGGAVTRLVDVENEVARQIATVMPARWAFEAALVIENKDRPMAVDFRDARHPDRPATKVANDFALVHYFFEESPHPPDRLWTCLGFLAIFPVVFSILATLSLRLKDVH